MLEKLINFLFPHICIFCSNVGEPVCEDCKEKFFQRYPEETFKNNETHFLDEIFINYAYNEPVSKLIFDFKYNGCFSYNEFLSDLIFENSSKILTKVDCITCVPMHRKKLWKRGYNQSELLAKSLAKKSTIPFINLIKKHKNTKSQADLKRKDRLKNLNEAFQITGNLDLSDKSVAIIDDVVTTGSTLNECAKILKLSGAKSVIGVVFAHSLR